MPDTLASIVSLIRDEMQWPMGRKLPAEITAETSLAADLNADAIDRAGLSLRIEDAFGIACDDAEFDRCVTVGDLVALVERRLGRKAA